MVSTAAEYRNFGDRTSVKIGPAICVSALPAPPPLTRSESELSVVATPFSAGDAVSPDSATRDADGMVTALNPDPEFPPSHARSGKTKIGPGSRVEVGPGRKGLTSLLDTSE